MSGSRSGSDDDLGRKLSNDVGGQGNPVREDVVEPNPSLDRGVAPVEAAMVRAVTSAPAESGSLRESAVEDGLVGDTKVREQIGLVIDSPAEGEVLARLELFQTAMGSFKGNREAKNFQALLMISGTNYREETVGKSAAVQKLDALVAQIDLAKTNAPSKLASCFGQGRSSVTQEGYDSLERILVSKNFDVAQEDSSLMVVPHSSW